MQLPTVLVTIAIFAMGQASAVSIPRRDDSGFGDFASGAGSALFGNAGTACSVGRDEGECDQFGRCVQFIPPNEQSVLNQGGEVAVCTVGGQTGTLKV
ncbi:hypothetical protein AUP68_05531 [Ilyonectria robusta]